MQYLFAFLLLFVSVSTDVCAQVVPSVQESARALSKALAEKKVRFNFKPLNKQASIDAAYNALQGIAELSVAASFDERAATDFLSALLTESKQQQFRDVRFQFRDQTASASINHRGLIDIPAVGQVMVRSRINLSLNPVIAQAIDDDRVTFHVRFVVQDLSVEILEAKIGDRPLGQAFDVVAEQIIAVALSPVIAIVNRVEVVAPTTIATRIKFKPSEKGGIRTKYEPDSVPLKVVLTAISYLIDAGRFTILAQEGGAPKAATPKNGVPLATLRQDARKLLSDAGAAWIDQAHLSAAVTRNYLKRSVAQLAAALPICIQSDFKEVSIPFKTKLSLPHESTIDCRPNRDCKDNRPCEQTQPCDQTGSCRKCLVSWRGRCQKRGNDPFCEAGKVRDRAQCEAGKVSRKAQCELAKEVAEKQCEAGKVAERHACEGGKATYAVLRRGGKNYANVESNDFRTSGNARVCVSEMQLNPDDLSLKAKMTIKANAKIDGRVDLIPLDFGHVLCFAKFDRQISESVSMPEQVVPIDTTALVADSSSSAGVNILVSKPIRVRLSLDSMMEKLALDPKFQVLCPLPSVAAKVRVLTPDSWWPRAARGLYDRELSPVAFAYDLSSIPTASGDLKLTGTIRKSTKAVGANFTFQRKRKAGG